MPLCGLDVGVGRFDFHEWTIYTTEDGLPHDSVQTIFQDDAGDMWFGCGQHMMALAGGGLSRFDGKTFANFTTSDGLPHNQVTGITQIAGRIAIATRDGVVFYGAHGFEGRVSVEDGLPGNDIHRMLMSEKRQEVWFLTGSSGEERLGGVARMTRTEVHTYTTADGLPASEATAILEDGDGGIWLGGRGWVSRFDGESWTTLGPESGMPDTPWILDGAADSSGDLWFACYNGVLRFDGETWTRFSELEDAWVASVCADRCGHVWVATGARSHLLRYEGDPWLTFGAEDLGSLVDVTTAIMADLDGSVWAAGRIEDSLSRYDGESWTTWGIQDGIPSAGIWAFQRDSRDHLWIGTLAGLSRYDGHRFENFTDADGLPGTAVIALCEDGAGNIWIGTESGAGRYDGRTWTRFTTADGLAHDRVKWIIRDRNDSLWFATAAGVSCFDGENWQSYNTQHGLAGDWVQMLTEDAEGTIWAASWSDATHSIPGGGLSRFDGHSWTSYGVEDGLIDPAVSAVYADRNGHIWIGTWSGGAGRFDGQVFQSIDHRDGLGHDMVWAIDGDDAGNIWFATAAGVTRHTPSTEPTLPSVAIDAVIADRRYDAAAELDLPASTSVVAFEFQGSSGSTRTDGLVYRYRLLGHDEQWLNTRERRVEIQEVFAGSYTFEVLAVDKEMAYSEVAELKLTVRNPLQERIDELEERVRERTADLEAANEQLEEQNRDLTAEQALQRVRAEALSMRESDDLKKVMAVAYRELRAHVPDLNTIAALVYDEAAGTRTLYVACQVPPTSTAWTSPDMWLDGLDVVVARLVSSVGESGTQTNYERWRKGEEWHEQTPESALHKYKLNVRELLGLRGSWPVIELAQRFECGFPYAQGIVAADAGRAFFDEELDVIRRFTGAVAIAHQRHLDLQEAETRAAEAEVEAALQRVRSEALSMRESEDLNKVMAVAYREIRVHVGVSGLLALIYDEQAGIRQLYLSTEAPPDGTTWASPALEIVDGDVVAGSLQHQIEDRPESSYARWRRGEEWHEHVVGGVMQRNQRDMRDDFCLQGPWPSLDLDEWFMYGFPFTQGEFGSYGERALTESEIAVICRFSEAAAIGYQRHLDFANLEEANREIQQADRHKSEFLASMSHDLRTPMNAIIGYTRILLRRLKGAVEERQYQNLENIQTSADSLLLLINDILDLSKIEAGRMDVEIEDVDVGALIGDCITSVQSLVKSGVELKQQFEKVDTLRTDSELLRRVIMNVLGNAVKFTESGSITVSLKPGGEGVELSVSDTGQGISPDELPHIFEEFRQVEGEGQAGGSGLGLSIAKKTIELLGGTIAAESVFGEGTMFVVMVGDYVKP